MFERFTDNIKEESIYANQLEAAGYTVLNCEPRPYYIPILSPTREILGFITRTNSPPGEQICLSYTLSTANQVLDLRDWLEENKFPYKEVNPDSRKHFAQMLRESASRDNALADRLEEKVGEVDEGAQRIKNFRRFLEGKPNKDDEIEFDGMPPGPM